MRRFRSARPNPDPNPDPDPNPNPNPNPNPDPNPDPNPTPNPNPHPNQEREAAAATRQIEAGAREARLLDEVRALHVRMEAEGDARQRDTQMAEELGEQVESSPSYHPPT